MPPSLVQSSSSPPATLHHFTLANGLRVYLQEDHRAPLVSVQLWYHVGSSYEPAGHSGISHALEHLMFAGSSKLAAGQYTSLMTRLGGSPNAFTGREATWFPLTLPANRLEVVLEAMADAMTTATLDEHAFADALQIIKAERRSNVEAYPLALALERHWLLAYGTRPYANPVIGSREDLEHMTVASTRTWYDTWYHPNNATLVVVGAIGSQHLRTLVERHFASAVARRLPPLERSANSTPPERRLQTLHLSGLREGVLISFDMPSQVTADSVLDACAIRLLSMLLADGGGSRIYRQLIRGEEVLQALGGEYEPFQRSDSQFSLYAYTNSKNATPEVAMEKILQVIQALRTSTVDADELKRAKARLLANWVFSKDDIAEQASVIGKYATCGLDPSSMATQMRTVEAVTVEHIRQAAHDYLTDARMTVTFMYPESTHD